MAGDIQIRPIARWFYLAARIDLIGKPGRGKSRPVPLYVRSQAGVNASVELRSRKQ